MTALALAVAISGMTLIGAVCGLVLVDRSGRAALYRYRMAHAAGRVLLDRTEEDYSGWPRGMVL